MSSAARVDLDALERIASSLPVGEWAAIDRDEVLSFVRVVRAAQKFIVADEYTPHPYREYSEVEAALAPFASGSAGVSEATE